MAVLQELREKVEADVLGRDDVSTRSMFGTVAYLVRGRMFAFWVGDGLVAKVPGRTRQELLDRKAGVVFQGPQGRGFGEWLHLPLEKGEDLEACSAAARDSYEYVRGQPSRRPARKRRR
jgi:hypothetical protein